MLFRILALLNFLQNLYYNYGISTYNVLECRRLWVLCGTGGDSCLQLFVDKGIPHTRGDRFPHGLLVQGMPDIWQAKVA